MKSESSRKLLNNANYEIHRQKEFALLEALLLLYPIHYESNLPVDGHYIKSEESGRLNP